MTGYAVDIHDIRAASRRIASHAHRTPVFTSRTINQIARRELFFKCENLQRVGAFKFRGAMNAIAQLSPAQSARGVVTHSSGNHAQAVALAASALGVAATIVMPTSAPEIKRRAVLGYGASVIDCEPTLQARTQTTAAIVERTGATLIHPYDNAAVIAGQGTVALELLEQVSDLEAIIAPVGGGGLLAGVTVATRALSPNTAIYGAEPAGADDAYRSLMTGVRVTAHTPNTVADGLLTTLGELNWPIIRDGLSGIVLVEDHEITAAMRLIWERMKLVAEPSGATALAAVLSGGVHEHRVGVVISGGNVELA